MAKSQKHNKQSEEQIHERIKTVTRRRRSAVMTGLAAVSLVAFTAGCGGNTIQNNPQPVITSNNASASSGTTGSSQNTNTTSTNSSAADSSSSAMNVLNQAPRPMTVVRNGSQVSINMYTEETTVQVAPGVDFHAWTFDGTVPGPVISLNQGDHVTLTLHNLDPQMSHSIDLHAALVAPNKSFVEVDPNSSKTLTFDATLPGVFMYHCATPPMALHIAQGMYGAVVVTPKGQQPPKYVIVQSEIYKNMNINDQPDYVVFNGVASQYVDHPLKAKVGEPFTVAFVNAGPNDFSAFHVVGTILRDAQATGNPANHLIDVQTYTVAPGDGALFHLKFDKAGLYPFVTHSMVGFEKGAVGKFDVAN